MGKKMSRQKSMDMKQIFASGSLTTASVTYPSICTSPSFHLSVTRSKSDESSDAFTWGQMQSLYIQQEFLTIEHLNSTMLKASAGVLEVLRKQLGQICESIYTGVSKFPEEVCERFGVYTANMNIELGKRMTTHFITLLSVHEYIMNLFRQNQYEEALEMIKQMAIAHALKGVTPTEFRMMDWFIIHYLIKNKITSDESINSLVQYLNIISNYAIKFIETQSVRKRTVEEMTRPKHTDRESKTRENFRLMRKWYHNLERFQVFAKNADTLLEQQAQLRHAAEENIRSIDTLTLKQQDFIMKHFTKTEKTEEEKKTKKQKRRMSITDSTQTGQSATPSGTANY